MNRVPVDKLLQWALNDELPKARHVMEDLRRIIERAAHADRPGISRRYIPPNMLQTGFYLGGAPHRDAIAVARAVQRFGVCAGLSSEASVRALLGPLADLEPQSISAALAVRPDVAALMITCAVLKRPPVVSLEHPKPLPVYIGGDRRRISVLRLDPEGELVHANVTHWNVKTHPSCTYGEPRCPIEWGEPKIKTVADQRAEYTIWWRALNMLAGQLAGKLKERVAAPLDCSATPWLQPPPKVVRVHGEQRAAGTEPLPLAPARGVIANSALKRPRLGGAVSKVCEIESNGRYDGLAA
jgi:hypothetical protein